MNNGRVVFPEYKKRIIRKESKILATGAYVPEKIVSNQDIIDAGALKVTDAAIQKTLGAKHRRVGDDGVVDSDLLVAAGQQALQRAGIQADQLSKILVSKFIGDRVLPMTAALVQRKLGCNNAMHAVDIDGGINSFMHTLDLATRYISTTAADEQYILILSGGLSRAPVSKTDPRIAFLFGDGAGAILLSTADSPHFLASTMYSNYEHFAAAGTRSMTMDDTISNEIYGKGRFELFYDIYQMGNWKDSLDFYLDAMEQTRDQLLAACGKNMADIDLVLLTENNQKMREAALQRLGVTEEKSLSLFSKYGNTMSAMLPLLLDEALQSSRLKEGMTVMLLSHGEGASGGGLIYKV